MFTGKHRFSGSPEDFKYYVCHQATHSTLFYLITANTGIDLSAAVTLMGGKKRLEQDDSGRPKACKIQKTIKISKDAFIRGLPAKLYVDGDPYYDQAKVKPEPLIIKWS